MTHFIAFFSFTIFSLIVVFPCWSHQRSMMLHDYKQLYYCQIALSYLEFVCKPSSYVFKVWFKYNGLVSIVAKLLTVSHTLYSMTLQAIVLVWDKNLLSRYWNCMFLLAGFFEIHLLYDAPLWVKVSWCPHYKWLIFLTVHQGCLEYILHQYF